MSHFENITSDRKLLELAGLHLGIRLFVGYELHQTLPWHSTLSRTRQRIPVAVFEQCFSHIVTLCAQKGLISGHTQAIDSAFIKANASLSSVQKKASSWVTTDSRPPQLARLTAARYRLQHIHCRQHRRGRATPQKEGLLLSNLTHFSPTDPDARIAFKMGKQRMLAYWASLSVDTAQHVITHIDAHCADGRDSRYLIALVDATAHRLEACGLNLSSVLADAGYSSGGNYQALEQLE